MTDRHSRNPQVCDSISIHRLPNTAIKGCALNPAIYRLPDHFLSKTVCEMYIDAMSLIISNEVPGCKKSVISSTTRNESTVSLLSP